MIGCTYAFMMATSPRSNSRCSGQIAADSVIGIPGRRCRSAAATSRSVSGKA